MQNNYIKGSVLKPLPFLFVESVEKQARVLFKKPKKRGGFVEIVENNIEVGLQAEYFVTIVKKLLQSC